MTEQDDCIVCHDIDGLGRHHPMCSRASQLGLPKRAEDEEPVPVEVAVVENDQAVEAAVNPQRGDKMCVACLEYHIGDEDIPNCKKVGKSLVHPTCAWRMVYEGAEAWQVIEELEKVAVVEIEGWDLDHVRSYVQDELRRANT